MNLSVGGVSISVGGGGGGHHHHGHPPGQLILHLDKYSYVGGEVINGTVEMRCHHPFHANGVFVKIEGYEHAKFQEVVTRTDSEGHTHRDTHLREDRHEFFCEKINVYPHSGPVSPGTMSFPFSYQLPPSLPGTYFEEGGDFHHGTGYMGEVIYFIEGKIDVHHGPDIKTDLRLVVNEKADRDLQPSYSENSKGFAFTKGQLRVKVWLDHNAYFPGNTVIAKLEANNTSVKKTRGLIVTVVRRLKLHAGHHTKHVNCEVYRKSYDGFEPSWYGVRFLPFQIPIGLQPSTHTSKMVQAHYDFLVTCDLAGAFNLVTKLDCTILAPQFMFASAPPSLPQSPNVPGDCSFRPPWQPDEALKNCPKCNSSFGMIINRRHHCRHCGELRCKACSSHESTIPALGYLEPVRVCDDCVDNAKAGGKVFQEAPDFSNSPVAEPEWQRPPPTNPELQNDNSPASAPPAVDVGQEGQKEQQQQNMYPEVPAAGN